MKVVGLDLAGKETNETGFCLLSSEGGRNVVVTKNLHDNTQIIEEVKKCKPDIVAIDAPLNLPEKGYFRPADEHLKRKGFAPLSPIFPGMKVLTLRAMSLVKSLSNEYKTIEVFPKATEKILGLSKERDVNENEYDALLCALTGKKFIEGEFENLSGVVVPK